jgi:hypothetical protein
VLAGPSLVAQPVQLLEQLGFDCTILADPYSAMAELCRNSATYRAVVLSLQSLYREELGIVAAIKQRLPHLDIWLTHTDGRQAALAEAMRLGADGLLADDGLHRIATQSSAPIPVVPLKAPESSVQLAVDSTLNKSESDALIGEEHSVNEPVLTADELRALLQEQPSMPPAGGSEN